MSAAAEAKKKMCPENPLFSLNLSPPNQPTTPRGGARQQQVALTNRSSILTVLWGSANALYFCFFLVKSELRISCLSSVIGGFQAIRLGTACNCCVNPACVCGTDAKTSGKAADCIAATGTGSIKVRSNSSPCQKFS